MTATPPDATPDSALETALDPVRAYVADLRDLAISNMDTAADYARRLSTAISERDDLKTRLDDLTDALPGYRERYGLPSFEDTFSQPDGPPDPAKWVVRDASTLGELKDAGVVTRGNVRVEGGILHLRANWLPKPIPKKTTGWAILGGGNINQMTHSTAYIDQELRSGAAGGKDIYSQSYGRWELDYCTPTGANTRGAMPAWWLQEIGGNLELDLMEAIGGGGTMPASWVTYLKDTAKSTFIPNTMTTKGKEQFRWGKGAKLDLQSPVVPHDGFHTTAFTRLPKWASLEVDGVELRRWTREEHPVIWGADPDHRPLAQRINLHVGEYYAQPDPAHPEYTKPLDFQVRSSRIWRATPEMLVA